MIRPMIVLTLLSGINGCSHFRLPEIHHRQKGCQAPTETFQDEIVTKAATPTVIVERPSRTISPQSAIQPQGGIQPQGAVIQPQGAVMPQMMMMPMVPFGTTPVNAEVRDRTRIGFVLDTFKISLPTIRAVPIQRPSEVTMQMPIAPQGASMPMVPQMGFIQSMAVAPQTVLHGATQMPLAPVTLQGMAQGTGYMAVPNGGALGIAPHAAVQPYSTQSQGINQINPQGANQNQQNDRLQAAERQVEELMKICEELKKNNKISPQGTPQGEPMKGSGKGSFPDSKDNN